MNFVGDSEQVIKGKWRCLEKGKEEGGQWCNFHLVIVTLGGYMYGFESNSPELSA